MEKAPHVGKILQIFDQYLLSLSCLLLCQIILFQFQPLTKKIESYKIFDQYLLSLSCLLLCQIILQVSTTYQKNKEL